MFIVHQEKKDSPKLSGSSAQKTIATSTNRRGPTRPILILFIRINWFPLLVVPKVLTQQRVYKSPLMSVGWWGVGFS